MILDAIFYLYKMRHKTRNGLVNVTKSATYQGRLNIPNGQELCLLYLKIKPLMPPDLAMRSSSSLSCLIHPQRFYKLTA